MKAIICKKCSRSWQVPDQDAEEFEEKQNNLCAACREKSEEVAE